MTLIKYSFALLACCCFFASASAYAEQITAERAEELCRVFIENPEQFKPLETEPCEILPRPNAEDAIPTKCSKFSSKKIQHTVIHNWYTGGTCQSSSFAVLDKSGEKPYANQLPISNVGINGYGMGDFDHVYTYEGDLFASHGSDLKLINQNDQTLLCEIYYQLDGWENKTIQDEIVCNEFFEGNYTIIREDISEEEVKQKSKRVYSYHLEPYAQAYVDLNNDGENETVTYTSVSSGAGCGCDDKFLNFEGMDWSDHFPNRCHANIDWNILEIGNKYYIYEKYQPYRDFKDFIYQRDEFPTENLYQINGDNVTKLCERKPAMKKILDRDIPGFDFKKSSASYRLKEAEVIE